MFNPLVSVIIPCFNRPDYLAECLASVGSQTYRNIELIVVDDASSDDIQSVLNSVEWSFPQHPRYVRLDNNVGPGGAREVGRQLATGDFVCYLDSDDTWHPDFVVAHLESLLNNPLAGMSYCMVKEFESSPITGGERIRLSRPVQQILPYPLLRRPWYTSSIMWTRKACEQIGPWYPGRFDEDREYEIRAGCLNIVPLFLPRALHYFRNVASPDRASAPSRTALVNDIPVTQSVIDAICAHNKHLERPVADWLALHLLKKLPGLVSIGERQVARSYLSMILRLWRYDRRLWSVGWCILLLTHIAPSKLLAKLVRIITKASVQPFVMRRYGHLFEGWDTDIRTDIGAI